MVAGVGTLVPLPRIAAIPWEIAFENPVHCGIKDQAKQCERQIANNGSIMTERLRVGHNIHTETIERDKEFRNDRTEVRMTRSP